MNKRNHQGKAAFKMKAFQLFLRESEFVMLEAESLKKRIPMQLILRKRLGFHVHLDCPTCQCSEEIE